ncbi:MAG: YfiR family protein [Bacteroidetes bacterium]|nr:YfiR family protein [Bacteroidota bacterium]
MQTFRHVLFILLVPVAGLLAPRRLMAQAPAVYPIEANVVYHFGKYIEWPDKDLRSEFVIGVIGDGPVVDEMVKLMAQRTADGKKIVIRKYASNSSSFNCQMLFICERARSRLREVILATAGMPVLIVAEGAGMARKGAGIAIAISDQHFKLEINKTNIERRKLQIADELIQLGTVVN